MASQNITAKLFRHALENPDRIALVVTRRRPFRAGLEERISYGQIARDTVGAAGELRARGFTKGDRILVFVPMSYALYVTVLAILYIGAEAVFVDSWASRKRLADCCRLAKPKGFIGSAMAQALTLLPELRRIPIVVRSGHLLARHPQTGAGADLRPSPEEVDPEDTAIITLTTGSTGRPKGARRSHGLLWRQFSALSNHLKLDATDVDMTILPIYVLQSLGLGTTSVLPLSRPTKVTSFDPALIVRQVLEHGVTVSLGPPAFFGKLADHLLEKKIVLPIRRIFVGGAPLFRDLAEKLVRAFPATELEVVYGCTEVLPISGISLREALRFDPDHGLPVGKRANGIELEVIRPDDGPIAPGDRRALAELLAERGTPGEVVVKGPHVLQRYLGGPEVGADNKIAVGGEMWHRTGDAGWIDPQGNLFLLGRVARRFHATGRTRYPIPYEQRLRTLPEVAFSAVLEHRGLLYAIVELDGASPRRGRRLAEPIRRLLGDIRPDRLLFLNEIPRDPRHQSKIDYDKLLRILPR